MSKCVYVRLLSAALIVASIAIPAAAKDKPKLDQALRRAANQPTTELDVIIRTVPGGHDLVRAKLVAKGRKVSGEHVSISAISATVAVGDLADLDRDPLVASVSINAVVRAHQVASDQDAFVPSGMLRTMVGATTLPTGQGVGVAIIDSGILNRPDLHDQLKAFYDFTVDGTPKAAGWTDPYGHGTHIAGTIASSGK